MAIKIEIPADVDSVKIDPLHQWDYGQTLEIESPIFASGIMEVHFSCLGMTEAIVRPCTGSNGIYTVQVPDSCLEQSDDITAWIYDKGTESGKTLKTISIPIHERPRPNRGGEIPQSVYDAYTEAINEINKIIGKLESGDIVVKKAQQAVSATNAQMANKANEATQAGHAAISDLAYIADTVSRTVSEAETAYNLSRGEKEYLSRLTDKGLYYVEFKLVGGKYVSLGTVYWDNSSSVHASCFYEHKHPTSGQTEGTYTYVLVLHPNGTYSMKVYNSSGSEITPEHYELFKIEQVYFLSIFTV